MSWNCPGCMKECVDEIRGHFPYDLCRNCYFNRDIVAKFRTVNKVASTVAACGCSNAIGHQGPEGPPGYHCPPGFRGPQGPNIDTGDGDIGEDPKVEDDSVNPHSDLPFVADQGTIQPNLNLLVKWLSEMDLSTLADVLVAVGNINKPKFTTVVASVYNQLYPGYLVHIHPDGDFSCNTRNPVPGEITLEKNATVFGTEVRRIPGEIDTEYWRRVHQFYLDNYDDGMKLAKTIAEIKPLLQVLCEQLKHGEVQRQMSKLQLIMGGQISSTGGLKPIRFDVQEEVARQMEDQKFQAEQQAKLQEEMDSPANKAYDDFTRLPSERENYFQRKIIPPLKISNDELDRSVPTNMPLTLMNEIDERVAASKPEGITLTDYQHRIECDFMENHYRHPDNFIADEDYEKYYMEAHKKAEDAVREEILIENYDKTKR